MPDWLEWIVFGVLWAPLLVLIHELGHAFAAMALTDGGDVEIGMRGGGVFGGSVHYEPARLRRARDEAWIAAAGPAASLLATCLLAIASSRTGWHSTLLGVGTFTAMLHFVTSALPLRYGKGFDGPADSDGRVIWRVLTGAPPGGVERELQRMAQPERAARPLYVVLLAIAGGLALLVEPVLCLMLVGLFGFAAVLQRRG